MLYVERSNRTEALLDGLARRLGEPGGDPLAPRIVVVQGPGMERWLAQALARRHGVCANVEFLFPQAFAEKLFRAVEAAAEGGVGSAAESDDEGPEAAWRPARLQWSIARWLGEFAHDADFAPLARHLNGEDAAWRRIQLAARVAALFDGYATHRPEWVTAWARGDLAALPADGRWQGRLFEAIAGEYGDAHFAARALGTIRALGNGNGNGASPEVLRAIERVCPDRIEIFAVSTLAPLYLGVLDALAKVRDLHLSVLSPSRGYWADLWREVAAADRQVLPPVADEVVSSLFAPTAATPAARLLAGLGRLGADFQWTLERHTSMQAGDDDRFASPVPESSPATLLQRLQADLLDPEEMPDPAERVVDAADDSIRVHLCHGARRELEVVEAVLRDAFERDPSLAPEDVIVMAPRIDDSAPDIEAVFGGREGRAPIPFRIADRGALRRSPVADCYASLLSLLTSRVTRSELVDWLSRGPARDRFGLAEEAVEGLEAWAVSAGVRFGLDADHRAALDLEADPAHTWSDGLARLALAHAVGPSDAIYEGIAAAPLGPFLAPETLGGLGSCVDLLIRARRDVVHPRPVGEWGAWFAQLLADACARDDTNAHEHTAIRTWLRDLERHAEAGGHAEPVPFEAVREVVLERLESNPPPQAFLAGGVTFCELVPLRAIPFRMVVLVGLADAAFPRGRGAPGYDLMARSPQPGDRSTRADDRHLFLEALLSARDRLVVTAPGKDLRDGSLLAPSIVVTELLDAIDASFSFSRAASADREVSAREALVVEHPLQPFDARYFLAEGDPRLLGRDADAHAAAQARVDAIAAGGGDERRFLPESLDRAVAADVGDRARLELDELAQRLMRTTRAYMRDRLGLRLPDLEEVQAEYEPVELGGLDRYSLGTVLVDEIVDRAVDDAALVERLLAQPILPTGPLGRLEAQALRAEILEIARIARRHRGETARPDHAFELVLDVEGLGPARLAGRLDRLCDAGRVVTGFTRIGRRSELDVWIRHLALCAAVEDGLDVPPRSLFVARPEKKGADDRVVTFEPVADPKAKLARLFVWARSLDRTPLPFFDQASRKFAKSAADDPDRAWRDAQQAYHGGEGAKDAYAEAEGDLEEARLWEGRSPVERDAVLPVEHGFAEVAVGFFDALQAARSVAPR